MLFSEIPLPVYKGVCDLLLRIPLMGVISPGVSCINGVVSYCIECMKGVVSHGI